jgi:Flp pilus assembly pilin Flp
MRYALLLAVIASAVVAQEGNFRPNLQRRVKQS